MIDLETLAQSQTFLDGNKTAHAEQIIWQLYSNSSDNRGISIREICSAFAELDLVEPNVTRLRTQLRGSRNIRKVNGDRYAPKRELSQSLSKKFSHHSSLPEDSFDVSSIATPPFVSNNRQEELAKMVKAYAHLFLLENSMRGLIEDVFSKHFGVGWWGQVANSKMKKKHSDRVANEQSKKWAPTRSDFGPLYALDWSDLITLMRKYPKQFKDRLKDINFLHRYDDTGTFRNVVAHNGVLRDQEDFDLIRIYYRDWIKQLS